METPEERARSDQREGIDLGEQLAFLRRVWWKILLFSIAVGTITLSVMFLQPNVYQATAVIGPAVEERRQTPTLGVLASFGVDLGSPSKVEDLETLFRSDDLTVRVIENNNLWAVVFPHRFDPSTRKLRANWIDRLFRGEKGQRTPGDWDAIRGATDRLTVSVNKKSGTVSISFRALSPEGSATVVKNYLEEGKNRLQEEAFNRATRNKKFIEEQISRTVDALTRDRLYALYGQEVEREMMARNREQFGFRVIDSPRIPDRKFKPRRGIAAVFATVLSFLVGWFFLVRKQ